MSPTERLAVFWHDDCLAHDTGEGVFEAVPSPLLDVQMPHPEGPTRLVNMRSVLQRGPVSPLVDWHDGRHASDEEILRFSTPALLAALKAADPEGCQFSSTTVMAPGSLKAIRAAAGTTLAALEAILDGSTHKAYALVRPPGHHAARDMVDGYCFVNNVGVAAETALAAGCRRIAVIDWDVHHGNGTQEGFYDRDDVLTVSIHMNHGAWGPGHPQTGSADERGRGAGEGFNVNIALPFGLGDAAYRYAFETIIAPKVEAFRPDLLVIANGQDANQFDPNGRQCVTMAGFHRLGADARALAETLTGGRLLLVQEGGYNPAYAAYCAHATVEGILGLDPALADPIAYLPDDPFTAREAVDEITRALGPI